MKEFYKVYIGKYEEQNTPVSWTLTGVVPKQGLKQHVKELVSQLREGSDVYIKTPKGEVKAYYRDKLHTIFK